VILTGSCQPDHQAQSTRVGQAGFLRPTSRGPGSARFEREQMHRGVVEVSQAHWATHTANRRRSWEAWNVSQGQGTLGAVWETVGTRRAYDCDHPSVPDLGERADRRGQRLRGRRHRPDGCRRRGLVAPGLVSHFVDVAVVAGQVAPAVDLRDEFAEGTGAGHQPHASALLPAAMLLYRPWIIGWLLNALTGGLGIVSACNSTTAAIPSFPTSTTKTGSSCSTRVPCRNPRRGRPWCCRRVGVGVGGDRRRGPTGIRPVAPSRQTPPSPPDPRG